MMADSSSDVVDTAESSPLGTVVVLLAGGEDRQWAARAAIDLCSEWASDGRRVVLTDLDLEDPLLHRLLGVPNLEGVVDIFVYGASLSRIAKPVHDSAFFFIPAGTYSADTAGIYADARWKKLVAGFRDTDATLVLFAPEGGADLASLARWSSDVFLLGPPASTTLRDELAGLGYDVRAELQSPRSAPADLADNEEEAAIWPPAGYDGPLVRAPATIVHRPPESELELPPPLVRHPAERLGAYRFLWILLAVVVVAAIAYLLFSVRPELLPGSSADRPAGALATEDIEPGSLLARQAAPLPYSVPVKAFSTFPAAQEEVAANRQRFQSVPFYISAEVEQGILYYRVFAGTSPDSVAAARLRQHLVEEGLIDEDDSPGSWSYLEYTPMAFDLGEFVTLVAAAERLDSLESRSIPAYATVIPYADGSQRWQLYSGAFRDSASAAGMRDLLAAGGIVAQLSARAGSPDSPLPGTAEE